jgi:hypothetical protein
MRVIPALPETIHKLDICKSRTHLSFRNLLSSLKNDLKVILIGFQVENNIGHRCKKSNRAIAHYLKFVGSKPATTVTGRK